MGVLVVTHPRSGVRAVCARRAQQVRANPGVLMKNDLQQLTEARIDAAECPDDKTWIALRDAAQRGLIVRIYRTGAKSYWYRYRMPGAGRGANAKWVRLGDVRSLSLKDARTAAKAKAGEVAKGGDPAASRRDEKRRERARLGPALDGYEASLEARQVVKRAEVMSLLRRELAGPLGSNADLAALDRAALVARIDAVRLSGRLGAARELRSRAGVFLGWCVDQGLIAGNPLSGWRQPRRTRAERLERRGRALADAELPGFWRGAAAQDWPFGPYLQVLLLTGQRRTETARMAWPDLVLGGDGIELWPDLPPQTDLWRVPPEITKSGRRHYIPLPRQAVELLTKLPRLNRCDFVFPGRRAAPMSGWSKRLPDAYAATAAEGVEAWTPHDLRRTMRTGLGRLGVDRVIAELLLDHAISDELAAIYDRGAYWPARVAAAQAWADHVFAQLDKKAPPAPRQPGNVIDLAEARR